MSHPEVAICAGKELPYALCGAGGVIDGLPRALLADQLREAFVLLWLQQFLSELLRIDVLHRCPRLVNHRVCRSGCKDAGRDRAGHR